jgi:hypothetical protein
VLRSLVGIAGFVVVCCSITVVLVVLLIRQETADAQHAADRNRALIRGLVRYEVKKCRADRPRQVQGRIRGRATGDLLAGSILLSGLARDLGALPPDAAAAVRARYRHDIEQLALYPVPHCGVIPELLRGAVRHTSAAVGGGKPHPYNPPRFKRTDVHPGQGPPSGSPAVRTPPPGGSGGGGSGSGGGAHPPPAQHHPPGGGPGPGRRLGVCQLFPDVCSTLPPGLRVALNHRRRIP